MNFSLLDDRRYYYTWWIQTEKLLGGVVNDIKQTSISDTTEEEWFGLFCFIPSAALKSKSLKNKHESMIYALKEYRYFNRRYKDSGGGCSSLSNIAGRKCSLGIPLNKNRLWRKKLKRILSWRISGIGFKDQSWLRLRLVQLTTLLYNCQLTFHLWLQCQLAGYYTFFSENKFLPYVFYHLDSRI